METLLLHVQAHNFTDSTSTGVIALNRTLTVISIICDILGNISLFLMIIYHIRLRAERVRDYHSPLFYQLFGLSIGIVAVRDISRFLSLFFSMDKINQSILRDMVNMLNSQMISLMFMFSEVIVSVTLLVSFLAAMQRIVIMYKPTLKYWVTGYPLYCLILIAWILSIHYFYIGAGTYFVTEHRRDDWIHLLLTAYRVLFLGLAVTTVFIYYHFYKLLSKLTEQEHHHKLHLLIQFVPIHVFLTIYSITTGIFVILIQTQYDMKEGSEFLFVGFAVPVIPIVVSLSYVASRENVRSLLIAVMGPIWIEITG